LCAAARVCRCRGLVDDGAGFPLWDTSSSQGRLLSTLLAAIAEFERDLIKERTGDRRKRAMAAGIKFGRKPKLSDFQRVEARRCGAARPVRRWPRLPSRMQSMFR
jgi:DNA invertase Pin-like site-specific DNA recombinase